MPWVRTRVVKKMTGTQTTWMRTLMSLIWYEAYLLAMGKGEKDGGQQGVRVGQRCEPHRLPSTARYHPAGLLQLSPKRPEVVENGRGGGEGEVGTTCVEGELILEG